jgi:hypothetical protein
MAWKSMGNGNAYVWRRLFGDGLREGSAKILCDTAICLLGIYWDQGWNF